MQPLSAAPRDHLTTTQVTDLLQAHNLKVSAGLELLDANLALVEDISDDLGGGTIERGCHNKIHGTCSLSISRALTWGVDLVRPYMTLSANGLSARWNVGVYVMVTPERTVGETPETYQVQGYDRLMLLDRQIGEDYTVTAGTTYRQALLDVFSDAGLTGVLIEGAAADATLPADKTWPLVPLDQADPDQTSTPATWLRAANDLLRAINFRAVWADENGVFRCQAYQDPATRAPEFSFDADSLKTIVGEERRVMADVWKTPNKWVFRNTARPVGAPAPTEGDGIYTVLNQSDGPTSIDERGLEWVTVIDYEAADQDVLVSLGNARVAADKRITTRYDVTTGPFPGAGHWDVFDFADTALGGTTKVQSTGWQMPLDGSDMTHYWEAVN